MRKLFPLWLLSLFLTAPGGWAEVSPDRMALLAKGININSWFSTWGPPADSPIAFHPEEAAFLKNAGFTMVRVPLAPNLLFDPDHPDQFRPIIATVDRGVRSLLDAGLAVVFDPIHGSSNTVAWEQGLAHDPGFRAKVVVYWEALARHLASLSSDRIFFEIMNEPHLTAQEKIDPSWWGPVQAELAAAARRGAPENTIIATGERWGGIDGLLGLDPLPDPNVVYSFHYYDPMTFTHQGAGWAGEVQAALAGVPYPSSPEAVAAPAAAIQDPRARAAVVRYGADRWNGERIRAGLTRAADWARTHHVSVFCGEFGAYRPVSAPEDRAAWIGDVRRTLEALGIGWSMWDYETDFGLVTWKEPRWRRGPQVDTSYLTALGLNAQATLASRPGETLMSDFSTGVVSTLDLPVYLWTPLWTRDPNAGQEHFVPDGGSPTEVAVVHTGDRDWALGSGIRLPVKPGESFTVSSSATVEGSGDVSLGMVTRDAAGKVLDWSFAGLRAVPESPGPVKTSFTVPQGVATLEPRWSGSGASTFQVGAFHLVRDRALPVTLGPGSLENSGLRVTMTPDGTLEFTDQRSHTSWKTLSPRGWGAVGIVAHSRTLTATLVDPHSGQPIQMTLDLDASRPEVEITVAGEGSLDHSVAYPPALTPVPGTRVVLPLNEGIWYPVDDPAVPTTRLVGYGGHGLSMDFWGVIGDPGAPRSPAFLAILETPDDASLDLRRTGGLLSAAPVWEPQKGNFGYPRKVRYVFFDQARLVDLTNRYRQAVVDRGDLVTLAQKRAQNPHVDQLVGAADVWYWDKDPVGMANELKQAGLDKVLWSAAEDPKVLAPINSLGYLTGRYDLYQDVMDPGQFSRLRGVQAEWTSQAWPAGLVLDRSGAWIHGWEVVAKDGTRIPCGVLSDSLAVPLAQSRIDADLAVHPYTARFIDTTTASPWREDWSPDHPLTRSESRQWRMKLLDVVSKDHHLVTGSETGQEAAVPHLDYFEGMMSLAPFRIPDAGRDMQKILDRAPEVITKFQVNEQYRIPLWELVYHDCVVSYWYWGDYSNKIPSVWDRRDLFNALYGTPPVYLFDHAFWTAHRDQFAASYRRASATAKATAYAAMTNFEVLTTDATVQRTSFANGISATVNFGSAPVVVDGVPLGPGDVRLQTE